MLDKIKLVFRRKLRCLAYKFERLKEFMRRKAAGVNRKKLLMRLIMVVLVGMLFAVFGIIAVFAYFSKDLPNPTTVVRRDGFSSRIYDRNGQVLYDLYKDAKRTPVTWEDIPNDLKEAVVSIEDKDFYKHKGFDPLTPFRIAQNLILRQRLIGGSTLTQQLVKNVLLSSERTVTRKLKEFILAVQIEQKYSKDEILLMYLNEAPYGGTLWGVGAAAEAYFGKEVKDLNKAECVILAGMPQRPSVFSPFSDTPTAYIGRSETVISRMIEDGHLSNEEAETLIEEIKNYKFYENKTTIMSPHFVFWIKDQLAEKYGEDVVEGGGLKITTTLDLELQNQVQQIISDEIDKAESMGISNGAAVVVDPRDGQVLAMVGSRGYYSDKTDGKFNVAASGLRQPGSSIKPITYLMGLKKGYTASTMIVDAPVTFPGTAGQKDYSPQNYNGKFNGPMSLRNALGNSINTTAVKMLAQVGVKNMLTQAYEMGLSTLEPTTENLSRFGLAVTLGGAEVKMTEMSAAYSAFANGGKKVDLVGVLKVEDRNGRVLEEYKPFEGKQVMTPQEAFIISNILSDNSARELTFGAVNGLIIPNYQVAVKTGTTNDKRDNWAIGWTPNLLSVVWVGNNDNSPMGKVASGVSGATPIWKKIMLFELPKRDKQDFPIPEKIVAMDVDKISGYAAHDGFAARQDYFIDGTQPKNDDPIHMKMKVCKGQSGLATPADVASGNYDEKEYIKLVEDDPVSSDGVNRWQAGVDEWINQQSDKDKYFPPESYCREGGLVDVSIESPSNESTVGSTFDIKINTTSLKKIVEVKVWIDGNEKKIWNERPYEMSMSLSDGVHKIKASVKDKDGNTAEREAQFGVNVPWNWSPSPTSEPTKVPTNTVAPTSAPSLTPTTSFVSPTP